MITCDMVSYLQSQSVHSYILRMHGILTTSFLSIVSADTTFKEWEYTICTHTINHLCEVWFRFGILPRQKAISAVWSVW